MSFQSPCPQECFFYEGHWNEELVGIFIRVLMDDAKLGLWVPGGENSDLVMSAKQYINVTLNKSFSWEDALTLVTSMKKRYTTFKHVLETPGVRWDRRFNHVHASPTVWEELFKWDEFTKSFYHRGDAKYEDLKSLFGSIDAAVPPETIVLSSDGPDRFQPNSAAAPIIILDSDNDEVSSPVMHARKPPRKKLFEDYSSIAVLAAVSAESNSAHLRMNPATKRGTKNDAGMFQKMKESSSTDSSSPAKVAHSSGTV